MVLVMLVALTSITMVAQESAHVKFDGYVVDQHCGSGMGAKPMLWRRPRAIPRNVR